MLPIHGSMRLLPVLFILTSIEAKRRRLEHDQENTNKPKNTHTGDVYPESFGESVDFGHVYKNENKNNIYANQLDMVKPTSLEHARQLLRQLGSDIISFKKPEEPMTFANPRDAIQYRMKNAQANGGLNISLNRPLRLKNATQTKRKSVEDRVKKNHSDQWSKIKEHTSEKVFTNDEESRARKLFAPASFNLLSNEPQQARNWTTCKDFGRGAVFHPDDVVNIPWLPFYIWSTRGFSTSVIHTLKYPTKKLVKQYKEQYGPHLNAKIDWEQPKLLLKEEKELLLIAGDRKGLFYGIPVVELPSPTKNVKIKIPIITVRLKIVDPYLAMMFCDEYYATIMSVAGSEPETDIDKEAEAAILKFQGEGSPAVRNLELEKLKAKFQFESKLREEASKYVKVEKPDNLDPSTF